MGIRPWEWDLMSVEQTDQVVADLTRWLSLENKAAKEAERSARSG